MKPTDSLVADAGVQMTHGTSAADMFGGIGGLIPLAFYLFFAYCQYTLSKKKGLEYSWLAWIPVLNVFNLVKIAGLSYWWILGLFVPLWNIYAIIKIYHGISKSTGHGGWWTVGIIFLYFIFFPITAFTYKSEQVQSPSSPSV